MTTSALQLARNARLSLEANGMRKTQVLSPSFDFKFSEKKYFCEKVEATVRADVRMLNEKRHEIGDTLNKLQEQIRSAQKNMYVIEEQLVDATRSSNSKSKEIDKIMSNLLIKGYEFIDPAVTVFTTEFLRKKDIVLGVYRIWIDWSKDNYRNALAIINIYKSASEHDHPCLDRGRLCVGTFGPLLEKHFKEKNIYSLVETIMAFLAQEDSDIGYYHSWKLWNGSARLRNPGFDFCNYNISPGRLPDNRQIIGDLSHIQRHTHTWTSGETTAIDLSLRYYDFPIPSTSQSASVSPSAVEESNTEEFPF